MVRIDVDDGSAGLKSYRATLLNEEAPISERLTFAAAHLHLDTEQPGPAVVDQLFSNKLTITIRWILRQQSENSAKGDAAKLQTAAWQLLRRAIKVLPRSLLVRTLAGSNLPAIILSSFQKICDLFGRLYQSKPQAWSQCLADYGIRMEQDSASNDSSSLPAHFLYLIETTASINALITQIFETPLFPDLQASNDAPQSQQTGRHLLDLPSESWKEVFAVLESLYRVFRIVTERTSFKPQAEFSILDTSFDLICTMATSILQGRGPTGASAANQPQDAALNTLLQGSTSFLDLTEHHPALAKSLPCTMSRTHDLVETFLIKRWISDFRQIDQLLSDARGLGAWNLAEDLPVSILNVRHFSQLLLPASSNGAADLPLSYLVRAFPSLLGTVLPLLKQNFTEANKVLEVFLTVWLTKAQESPKTESLTRLLSKMKFSGLPVSKDLAVKIVNAYLKDSNSPESLEHRWLAAHELMKTSPMTVILPSAGHEDLLQSLLKDISSGMLSQNLMPMAEAFVKAAIDELSKARRLEIFLEYWREELASSGGYHGVKLIQQPATGLGSHVQSFWESPWLLDYVTEHMAATLSPAQAKTLASSCITGILSQDARAAAVSADLILLTCLSQKECQPLLSSVELTKMSEALMNLLKSKEQRDQYYIPTIWRCLANVLWSSNVQAEIADDIYGQIIEQLETAGAELGKSKPASTKFASVTAPKALAALDFVSWLVGCTNVVQGEDLVKAQAFIHICFATAKEQLVPQKSSEALSAFAMRVASSLLLQPNSLRHNEHIKESDVVELFLSLSYQEGSNSQNCESIWKMFVLQRAYSLSKTDLNALLDLQLSLSSKHWKLASSPNLLITTLNALPLTTLPKPWMEKAVNHLAGYLLKPGFTTHETLLSAIHKLLTELSRPPPVIGTIGFLWAAARSSEIENPGLSPSKVYMCKIVEAGAELALKLVPINERGFYECWHNMTVNQARTAYCNVPLETCILRNAVLRHFAQAQVSDVNGFPRKQYATEVSRIGLEIARAFGLLFEQLASDITTAKVLLLDPLAQAAKVVVQLMNAADSMSPGAPGSFASQIGVAGEKVTHQQFLGIVFKDALFERVIKSTRLSFPDLWPTVESFLEVHVGAHDLYGKADLDTETASGRGAHMSSIQKLEKARRVSEMMDVTEDQGGAYRENNLNQLYEALSGCFANPGAPLNLEQRQALETSILLVRQRKPEDWRFSQLDNFNLLLHQVYTNPLAQNPTLPMMLSLLKSKPSEEILAEIPSILGMISVVATSVSSPSPHYRAPEDRPPRSLRNTATTTFHSLKLCCTIFQLLLVEYRSRVTRYMHIVIPTAQHLLQTLFVAKHTDTSNEDGNDQQALYVGYAAVYARLLETLCNPTEFSLTRGGGKSNRSSKPDGEKRDSTVNSKSSRGDANLSSQVARYRSTLSRLVSPLLFTYISAQLQSSSNKSRNHSGQRTQPFTKEVRDALLPGLFALLDVLGNDMIPVMSAALDAEGRVLLRALWTERNRAEGRST